MPWRRTTTLIFKYSLDGYGALITWKQHEYGLTQRPSCSGLCDFVNTCRLAITRCMSQKLIHGASENIEYWIAGRDLRTAQLTTRVRMTYCDTVLEDELSWKSSEMQRSAWCTVGYSMSSTRPLPHLLGVTTYNVWAAYFIFQQNACQRMHIHHLSKVSGNRMLIANFLSSDVFLPCRNLSVTWVEDYDTCGAGVLQWVMTIGWLVLWLIRCVLLMLTYSLLVHASNLLRCMSAACSL